MKKTLQNFGSILSILFKHMICNLATNLAGFRNCLAEYTEHSLSPCYGLFTALVLLNSVARCCNTTQFFTKMVSFHMLECMGVGSNFSGGPRVDFSKRFLLEAKSSEIWFLPLETKKTAFFVEIVKFLPLFRH